MNLKYGVKNGWENLIKSNRKVILEGMRDGIPIGLGYLAVSFSLGIAAKLLDLMRFKAFLQAFCATHRQVNIRDLP